MRSTARILGDRYVLEDLLGRGGMAEVYRGHDRVLDRPVAVKVPASYLTEEPAVVARMEREARAVASLSHPGIVTIFDTGNERARSFIVMELVEGRTLAEVLREQQSLPEGEALEIAAGVADALAYAHRQGVVHRDVKPGNVMLPTDGGVKVMDFGIARAAEASHAVTDSGAFVGSATYLAPEQAREERLDPRTDVYALGVVLYQMLTGRPPFMADTPLALAYKHLAEEPVPPSELNPDLSPAAEALVLSALAKDPEDRPPSEGLAERLRQFLSGEAEKEAGESSPTAAGYAGEDTGEVPATLGAEPGDRRTRRRLLLAVLVILSGLCFAGIWAFTGASDPSPKEPQPAVGETRHGLDRRMQAPATSAPSPFQSPKVDSRPEEGSGEAGSVQVGDGGESTSSPEPPATSEPTPDPTATVTTSPSPAGGTSGAVGAPLAEPTPTP